MIIVEEVLKLVACGTEVKAPPSIEGEVLCCKFSNAVHGTASESQVFPYLLNIVIAAVERLK